MSITVIKKGVGSATHRETMRKEVFDPHVREHFENKYKGMEHVLKGGEEKDLSGTGTYKPIERIQDVQMFRHNMNEAKRHAEKGAPVKLTPQERDELWRKAREIKNRVTQGMVPWHDLHPVKTRQVVVNNEVKVATVVDNDKLNQSRAVDRNIAWEKKNGEDLKEFRRVVRVLDPDYKNPMNLIEKMRPK